MKVSKVGPAREGVSTKRKKSVAKDAAFADQVRDAAGTGEPEGSHAVDQPSQVGAVDSIVALQEVPDATDGRSRKMLKQYGDELLDRLDELRLAILAGAVSKERLAELAHRLREKRKQSDDPRLNEIIDEIELRAEVEVAKLTRDR